MSAPAPRGLTRRGALRAVLAAAAAAAVPAVVATVTRSAPSAEPPRRPWTGRDRRPRWIGHC